MKQKLTGIIMIDDGVKSQIVDGLTFKEAFSAVVDFRSKRDGMYYYIGMIK